MPAAASTASTPQTEAATAVAVATEETYTTGDLAPLRAAGSGDEKDVDVAISQHLTHERAVQAGITNAKGDIKPGDKVKVHPDVALALAGQGYVVDVNPNDPAQVRAAAGRGPSPKKK